MLIETRILGSHKPLFPAWTFQDIEQATESLEGFLQRVVATEVKAFNERQETRRLIQVLSKEAIEEASLKGKVSMGGYKRKKVDEAEAIEAALQAFKDGLYFVFVDDRQIEDLEEKLSLRPDSKVLFLRLVPLVGG